MKKLILILFLVNFLTACSNFREERHLFSAEMSEFFNGNIRLTIAGTTSESSTKIIYGNPYVMSLLFDADEMSNLKSFTIVGSFKIVGKDGLVLFSKEIESEVTGGEKHGQKSLIREKINLEYTKHTGYFVYSIFSKDKVLLDQGQVLIPVSYKKEIYRGHPLP